jgi:hypothetical protein
MNKHTAHACAYAYFHTTHTAHTPTEILHVPFPSLLYPILRPIWSGLCVVPCFVSTMQCSGHPSVYILNFLPVTGRSSIVILLPSAEIERDVDLFFGFGIRSNWASRRSDAARNYGTLRRNTWKARKIIWHSYNIRIRNHGALLVPLPFPFLLSTPYMDYPFDTALFVYQLSSLLSLFPYPLLHTPLPPIAPYNS